MDREVRDDSIQEEPTSGAERLHGAGQRVFIAAGQEDAPSAERLCAALAGYGFDARCSPAGNRVGDEDLQREIGESDFVVVMLSSRSMPHFDEPVPVLARTLHMVGQLRAHAMYLLPVRLDQVQASTLDARHLHVIDLFPDWEQGEREIVRSMVANFGRWDLESRHFLLLGFAAFFVVSVLVLVFIVLPRILDPERSLGPVLIAAVVTFTWSYATFMASAWYGGRLGRWARGRRLEREWAWRGFAGLAVAAALLLILL